jgi:predicted ribosome quality control (RQC) complex YloA/Tae2 family protein
MTSFDIAAIVDELDERLRGARIMRAYHLPDTNAVFLRLRLSDRNELLIIQAARRISCTEYVMTMPERPSQFALELRGHLDGGIVEGISQLGFDRIVSISVRAGARDLELVAELLPRGNILIIERGVIMSALFRRAMRDRRIARGEVYRPPPSNTVHPLELKTEQLVALLGPNEGMGHLLARKLGYGPPYSDEICIRAGLRPEEVAGEIGPSGAERVLESARQVYGMAAGHGSPGLYRDATEQLVGFSPFALMTYQTLARRECVTMNQLVDDYFIELEAVERRLRTERAKAEGEGKRGAAAERLRLTADEMLSKARELRQCGEIIFGHLSDVQEVLDASRDGRDPRPFSKARALGITSGKERRLRVEVSGKVLELPLSQDASRTASAFFDQAKRLEEDSKMVLEKVEDRVERVEVVVKVPKAPLPEKRRQRAWFEGYRSFTSSDGILVVCGKDASSNEALIKKHASPNNPVFHSDVTGAPFVLVMADAEATPEGTLQEAAQMAASYTTWAWQAGYGSIDVFWVRASELTKSPPSGEYLPRGAFVVSGRKNYVRGSQLILAVGVIRTEGVLRAICAPLGAITSRTSTYVRIAPGATERRGLAQQIKAHLLALASEGEKAEIAAIGLEDILSILPAKSGIILRQ